MLKSCDMCNEESWEFRVYNCPFSVNVRQGKILNEINCWRPKGAVFIWEEILYVKGMYGL